LSKIERLLVFWALICIASISAAADTNNTPTQSRDKPRLEVGFAVFEYPPLYHSTADGDFSGILGETFKALCERGNLQCTFNMLPVARAYKSLMTGSNQILISGKHPKFKKCCRASQWTYPWTSGIYSKNPLSEIPASGKELIGKSLIVLRGWIAPYVFQPKLDDLSSSGQLTLYKSISNQSAIRMLQSDRAQLLYGATEFRWYFDKMGLTGNFNFRHIRTMPLVLWVSTDRADILKRLDDAFEEMKAEGILTKSNILKPEILSARYVDAPFTE